MTKRKLPELPLHVSPYWPHAPHPRQAAFLLLPQLEAFYGGAAGGGKTEALLMAALQGVDTPGYGAILFRRSFPELDQEDSLIPRSKEWLMGRAGWDVGAHRWTFPSGATLSFGHMQREDDRFNYRGGAWQFIGFDELTSFTERQYRYLFSRLRRLEGYPIPLRVRAASNPGDIGHEWVRRRFIDSDDPGRIFLPARLVDNPSLDRIEYAERSLSELDHVTRRQLLEGNWEIREAGELFRREWFEVMDEPAADCRWVRFWDLAATKVSDRNPDPDWTVGLKLGRHPNGVLWVADVRRVRKTPAGVENLIRKTADVDGVEVGIWIEQEPGAAGKSTVDHFVRQVLPDCEVRGLRSTGSKEERARPVSAKAEAGILRLVRGAWLDAFLDELEAFPTGGHDDQVDALSGAFTVLQSRVRHRSDLAPASVMGQSSWRS